MFSSLFWRKCAERAIKSFAQSLAAVLTASGLGLFDAPWPTALSTAAMVALLSVLTSLASVKIGDDGTPSVVPAHDTPTETGSAVPAAA